MPIPWDAHAEEPLLTLVDCAVPRSGAQARAFKKANFPWERYVALQRKVQRYEAMLAAQARLEAAQQAVAAASAAEGGEWQQEGQEGKAG